MTSTLKAPVEPRTRGGTFWALVPVGLLLASVGGVGSLSLIAAHDPGFALEKDYYQRAVHWDAQRAQWAQNARLGYRISLDVHRGKDGVELTTALTDHAGMPVRGASVEVEAFANARADDRRQWTLTERSAGTYGTSLGAPRPGLWEFRFVVTADGERFTAIERADVSAGGVL